MEKYESLYIVQPNLVEDQVDEIVKTFETIKTEKWGKRKLAYRIGKHWEGYYVLYEYEGDGSIQRELERRLKIHDDVIRFITVAVDPRMAAELERKAERDKKNEGRRDEGDGWGEGRDRYGDRDRDDYQGRGPRRERSGRDGEDRS